MLNSFFGDWLVVASLAPLVVTIQDKAQLLVNPFVDLKY